jgi:hypothetical protein
VARARSRARVARDEHDDDRDSEGSREDGERPERQHAGRGSEDEQEGQPQRARSADGGRDATGRPEPPVGGERPREERDAHCAAELRGRDGVQERADAVAGARVRPAQGAPATGERAAPRAPRRGEGGGERERGRPQPRGADREDAAECLADTLAEQLRRRSDHDQRADGPQREQEMTGPELEKWMHRG